MPRAMRKDRAPAACFTAWGSPGDRIPGGWSGAAAQAGMQLSWGSVVPGLNKRPRYSARGQVCMSISTGAQQSAPRGAPESIALRGRISATPHPASNKEVRGGKDDPRYERRHARKQHNVDDELRHDTLPTHTRPLSRCGLTRTPEAWRKGDGALPKFKQRYPCGKRVARLAGVPRFQMLSASNSTMPSPIKRTARATGS
jgi:hypothetical protein